MSATFVADLCPMSALPLRIPLCESRGRLVMMDLLPFGPRCDYFPVLACRMQWTQWRSGPFKVFEALMKPAPVSRMHWLNCFEGRRCPASRRMWKDVIGVPLDCLLDIASDILAPVRVSRKRERRGCFSFNETLPQADCMPFLDFVLLFIQYNWATTGLSTTWEDAVCCTMQVQPLSAVCTLWRKQFVAMP